MSKKTITSWKLSLGLKEKRNVCINIICYFQDLRKLRRGSEMLKEWSNLEGGKRKRQVSLFYIIILFLFRSLFWSLTRSQIRTHFCQYAQRERVLGEMKGRLVDMLSLTKNCQTNASFRVSRKNTFLGFVTYTYPCKFGLSNVVQAQI